MLVPCGLDMNSDQRLHSVLDEAHSLHLQGFNCAETVVWALADYWGIQIPVSYATAFGGGIARSGATCGALTGAILAIGAFVGRTDPRDDEGKKQCYRLGQCTIRRFEEKMGTTLCGEIIGFILGEPGGAERYAASDLKDTKCKDAVTAAVLSAVEAVEAGLDR